MESLEIALAQASILPCLSRLATGASWRSGLRLREKWKLASRYQSLSLSSDDGVPFLVLSGTVGGYPRRTFRTTQPYEPNRGIASLPRKRWHKTSRNPSNGQHLMNKAQSFTHCSACSTKKERGLFIYYLTGSWLHSADPPTSQAERLTCAKFLHDLTESTQNLPV